MTNLNRISYLTKTTLVLIYGLRFGKEKKIKQMN